MSIRVPGPGRRDGDRRPDGIDKCLGRCRPAAVVRDLEQVDVRQTVRQQGGVDAILDIAHQQEPTRPDLAEEDDRDVVDAGPAIGWHGGNPAADRPQHPHGDLVDGEPVTRGQAEPDRAMRSCQLADPRRIAGSRSAHPGFEHAIHVVTLEEERESGHMILVGMGQDDGVDPAIPRRDAAVERDKESIGIGSAIDQQSATVGTLDEDGVALSDIEDRDAG
jgi:hypothetical protein